MSKQVIMYDESTDDVKFAQLDENTFAVSKKADGTFEPMTYNEWEALRCEQACAAVVAGLPAGEKRDKIAADLEAFRDTMKQKYLEGNRSWVQLFEQLAKAFQEL